MEIPHKFILSDSNWWKRNCSLTLHNARPITFIHLMYLIKFMCQKNPCRNKIVNSWYLLVYPFNLNGISFFLSCEDFQLIHPQFMPILLSCNSYSFCSLVQSQRFPTDWGRRQPKKNSNLFLGMLWTAHYKNFLLLDISPYLQREESNVEQSGNTSNSYWHETGQLDSSTSLTASSIKAPQAFLYPDLKVFYTFCEEMSSSHSCH